MFKSSLTSLTAIVLSTMFITAVSSCATSAEELAEESIRLHKELAEAKTDQDSIRIFKEIAQIETTAREDLRKEEFKRYERLAHPQN